MYLGGEDGRHVAKSLRMRPGETVLISSRAGGDYLCRLEEYLPDRARFLALEKREEDMELPARIFLFQGLPKGDKMEYVIQKSVELGAVGIVPMETSRAVVRLEGKKAEAKRVRWQGISESAAKQAKRMIVPEIAPVMTFKEALLAAGKADLALIPYEDSEHLPGAGGMALTRELIGGLKPGQSMAVLIGPEGGFSDEEIRLALEAGIRPVTLGKRILRTETAALFVLSAAGLLLES